MCSGESQVCCLMPLAKFSVLAVLRRTREVIFDADEVEQHKEGGQAVRSQFPRHKSLLDFVCKAPEELSDVFCHLWRKSTILVSSHLELVGSEEESCE